MRHVRSVWYALVLAPAVWVLAGAGLMRDLTARGRDDFAVESVTGLLLLVLAGAAYAILLLAPISAAGPLVGGLAFLGISVWVLVSPSGYAGVWPESVAKDGFDLSRPGYGLAALLALPLICVALSRPRWARRAPRRDSSDSTEEMRLPLIMPGSDDTTTVLTPTAETTVLPSGERTFRDADVTAPLPSEEPTIAGTRVTASEEPTLPGTRVTASEEPTLPLGTAAISSAGVIVSEEPTVAVSAESPETESTLAVPTRRDEPRTVVVVSWDEVAAVAALSEGQASTRVTTSSGAVDTVTAGILATDEPAENEATGNQTAGDEAVVVGRAAAPPVSQAVRPGLEETRSLEAADPDRTRTIDLVAATAQLRVTAESPDPMRAINAAAADDSDATRPISVVGPDDADVTRPISVVHPDDADVTRPLELPSAPVMRLLPVPVPPPIAGHPGEVTAVLGRSVDEDETQVIRLDAERTQVMRAGSVEAPGERTEIVRLPVKGKAAIPGQRGPEREQSPEDEIPA